MKKRHIIRMRHKIRESSALVINPRADEHWYAEEIGLSRPCSTACFDDNQNDHHIDRSIFNQTVMSVQYGIVKMQFIAIQLLLTVALHELEEKIKDKLISQTRVKIALINTLQGGEVRTKARCSAMPPQWIIKAQLQEILLFSFLPICDMNEGLINNDRLDLLLHLPLLLALVWSASAEEERRRRQRRWAVIIETKHVRHAAI